LFKYSFHHGLFTGRLLPAVCYPLPAPGSRFFPFATSAAGIKRNEIFPGNGQSPFKKFRGKFGWPFLFQIPLFIMGHWLANRDLYKNRNIHDHNF
jgi:hypothetical protein